MANTVQNTSVSELREIFNEVMNYTKSNNKKVLFVFDTETTGLGGNSHMTSIGGSFIDEEGNILKNKNGEDLSFETFFNSAIIRPTSSRSF